MRSALAVLALAASAAAGAVSGSIAPSGGSPSGCSKSYSGDFEITPTNLTSSTKRSLKPRDSKLFITLSNGVLMDSEGRTGYVAANQQFQFDDPPQAGAIYTAGFSACSNGSLALGDDSIWYSCLSGNFYNLYFESQGGQCFPVTLQIQPTGGSAPATTAAATTGAPPATTAAPPPPPATSSEECSQYVDGQPQCSSVAAECSEYVDGQPQCSSATVAPVCSEYTDGQPQCSSATAAPVCSEYVDGQPQCSSAAPEACSEYTDGQPQCSTAAPVCSEYVDGQPQCSSAVATGTMPVASGSYTGAPIASGLAVAPAVGKEMLGLAAGVMAIALL